MSSTLKWLVINIPGAREGIPTSQPLPFLDSSILLSMHQLMSTMMSQLQPVLESFNQTLKHLSSEVHALSQDLQQLRMEKEDNRSMNIGESHSGLIEQKLELSHLQISQMKTQLDTQKDQIERAFQAQQELLKHNLTKLKEEMVDQLSQSHDTQVIHFPGLLEMAIQKSQHIKRVHTFTNNIFLCYINR